MEIEHDDDDDDNNDAVTTTDSVALWYDIYSIYSLEGMYIESGTVDRTKVRIPMSIKVHTVIDFIVNS